MIFQHVAFSFYQGFDNQSTSEKSKDVNPPPEWPVPGKIDDFGEKVISQNFSLCMVCTRIIK